MPQRLLFIALLLAIAACGSPEDDAPEHTHDTDADIETDAGTDASSDTDTDTPDADAEPEDLLEVERQVLTEVRDEVSIAQVRASQPGWVAIYELDDPGDLSSSGELLASVEVEAGDRQDVAVSLPRELEDGEWLLARLHRDAPHDGVFGYDAGAETPDDPPALNAYGEPVVAAILVRVPTAGLQVTDQTLEFSTRVTIASVSSDRPALLAILDADEVAIAVAPLTPGLFEMLPLTLSRPITTPGETLRVRLFEDVDEDGELDEAVDTLQTDAGGAPLDLSFEATHADPADPAPAVRFEMASLGTTAYLFESAEPAEFTDAISDTEAWNPTVTLKRGWRYEINNQGINVHPFDLLDLAAQRRDDVLLASQGRGLDPAPESDPRVAWIDDGPLMRFTVAGELLGEDGTPGTPNTPTLSGYRCAVTGHADMRGAFVIED
ncbi:hypothetical protein FRC98_17175 [Lujinxingia vulgaris]|uniref:DUF7282 domain-containing protein n=1 Tax=Lujinxingia vulgaris TaxID=2600176 RepID=A0A5C6X033_9DELT|nr:hypothetical protein [Lujinxingia vulgaris]TXD35197.1 hypothetical protein FRC98_17175 [Lujinxingia vulgaris]